MENVVLYYNEAAGSFRLGNEKLIQVLEDYGYNVIASSIVKNKMRLLDLPDYSMIVIAGGDGSVKNICLRLIDKNIRDKKIAILPFGTANNIALHFEDDLQLTLEQICQKWTQQKLKPFDVGKLIYKEKNYFFLESFGFGLFPLLMKTMEKMTQVSKLPSSQKLKIAIMKLYKSLFDSKGAYYSIDYDGKKIEGHYLLVEIMNIKSLGPRWKIAPAASADDGYLDIVLIPYNKKQQLIQYIKLLSKNVHTKFPFKSIKAQNVTVTVFGKNILYHLDDTLSNSDGGEFQLSVLSSYFRLMV